MGNLLRILLNGPKDDTSDIFVDFENCRPAENELELWNFINDKLQQTGDILAILREYNGAVTEIREAITNHGDQEAQIRAWTAVLPLISKLQRCYDFGVELAETVPRLLSALCSSEMTVNEHLENQQALFKQFAEILDFVLTFDDLKMMNPSIQNDFSFYRRSCSRRRTVVSQEQTEQNGGGANEILPDEYCSKISLFYAEATPMLKLVSKCTSQWRAGDKSIPVELTTECLASMTQICRGLVVNPELRSKITREDTFMLCLRVMTGVIILYDHIDPNGVFRKYSKIDVKSCIRLLKDQEPKRVECLLNALRYSTLHFNEESTPKPVKHLLAS